jgi:hypothetical protein
MKYWVTVQWPPLKKDKHRPGVYLRSEKSKVAKLLKRGDRVLIYQTQSGPTKIDDRGNRIHREKGKQGIIEVSSIKSKCKKAFTEEYIDEETTIWQCVTTFAQRNETGFVPRTTVYPKKSIQISMNWFFSLHSMNVAVILEKIEIRKIE